MIIDIKERNLKIKLDFKNTNSIGLCNLKSFKVLDQYYTNNSDGVIIYLTCEVYINDHLEKLKMDSFFNNKVLENNFVYRNFELDDPIICVKDDRLIAHNRDYIYCEIIKIN